MDVDVVVVFHCRQYLWQMINVAIGRWNSALKYKLQNGPSFKKWLVNNKPLLAGLVYDAMGDRTTFLLGQIFYFRNYIYTHRLTRHMEEVCRTGIACGWRKCKKLPTLGDIDTNLFPLCEIIIESIIGKVIQIVIDKAHQKRRNGENTKSQLVVLDCSARTLMNNLDAMRQSTRKTSTNFLF